MENFTQNFLLYAFLVFCRISTAIYLMPGLGEKYIPRRIKIALSLCITTIIASTNINIADNANRILYVELIVYEILIGITFGVMLKIVFGILNILGFAIAMQSGLAAATFFDNTQKDQVSVFGGFLNILGLATIFVTNTHHLFIEGIFETYDIIPMGHNIQISQNGYFIPRVVGDSFISCFKILAPFLIVNSAISLGSGILARLMPNLQVFFVLTPIQIMASFAILFLTVDIIANDFIIYTTQYVKIFITNGA